jgi:hypothetical protein
MSSSKWDERRKRVYLQRGKVQIEGAVGVSWSHADPSAESETPLSHIARQSKKHA